MTRPYSEYLHIPGRSPEFISLMPALIAAVSSETLYLLLPHVTVPDGRERPTILAAAASDAAKRANANCLNMVMAIGKGDIEGGERALKGTRVRNPALYASRLVL